MGRLAGAVAGSIATGKLLLPWFLSITSAMTGYGSEVKEARMVMFGLWSWCLVSYHPIRAA
jgi:hypothetical protein